MNRRRVGLMMMVIGTLTVAAGLGLGLYNLWDSNRAGIQANAALNAIVQYQEMAASNQNTAAVQTEEPEPSKGPDWEMPMLEIDGLRYIGTVSIPVIDIALPVQESWSSALLGVSPCRYMGSVYERNMIICGHNYVTHFGRLGNLLPGDRVIFTDVKGSEFLYVVEEICTISGMAVEEMHRGDWDLTLFTCNFGGQARITVRCSLFENDEI